MLFQFYIAYTLDGYSVDLIGYETETERDGAYRNCMETRQLYVRGIRVTPVEIHALDKVATNRLVH